MVFPQIEKQRSNVLIFSQWFTPARKAGGPIRSIENLVNLLHPYFNFYIVAGDRDLGDINPMDQIVINQWVKNDTCTVWFLNVRMLNSQFIRDRIREISPVAVYFNSMYAFRFSLYPIGVLKSMNYGGKIILAPRGMLKSSAVKFKFWKKQLFLGMSNAFSFFKNVYFQATDELELEEIRKSLRIPQSHIHMLMNVPYVTNEVKKIQKDSDHLDMVFVGRIHPIKGLITALQALRSVEKTVTLQIIGWIENEEYYQKCVSIIQKLPSNVSVTFSGDMPFDKVIYAIQQSHVLILPTHGENFGHSIFESMSSGRPVIISNETPWKNLAHAKAGINVPEDSLAYSQAIEFFAKMDNDTFQEWSTRAMLKSKEYVENAALVKGYCQLFTQRA